MALNEVVPGMPMLIAKSSARARLILLASSSAANRFLALGLSIVSVPVALNYLGPERFGVWVAVNSMASVVALADLGIGSGLVSATARANGGAQPEELVDAVSNATAAILILVLAFAALLACAFAYLDWTEVFKLNSGLAQSEVPDAVLVFAVCQLALIPLSVAYRIQTGLQRAHEGELRLMTATVVGFLAWLLAVSKGLSLPWLVAAIYAPPLLAHLVNSTVFFACDRLSLRPTLQRCSAAGIRSAMSTGSLFLFLQVTATIGFGLDYLIISSTLGAESLAEFAIVTKLFGLISMAAALLLKPLWPAYGEAWARGDAKWVEATAKQTIVATACVSTFLGIGMFLGADGIVLLWTGHKLAPEALLFFYSAVWAVVQSVGSGYSMLLNGLHVLRFQALVGTCFAALSLTLKLVSVQSLGVAGIVLASIVAYTVAALIPYIVFFRRNFGSR